MSKNLFIDNELGEVRLESIGQDITLRGGPNDTNVAGGGVKILATDGDGTGGGSNIEITAGSTGATSTGSGGNLVFLSGNAPGPSGSGGDITIKSGFGLSGGPITLSGGSGTGSAGGIARLLGGRSFNNVGGAAIVAGGRGSTGGGAVTVLGGGTEGAATGGPGGDLTFQGGLSDQNGGDVLLAGGDFDTNGATNDGGDVLVRSGRRSALSEGSGEARVFLEKATGQPGVVGAAGGKVEIYAGDGRTDAGNIDIQAGSGGSASGSAGDLILTAGQSSDTDGGNMIFTSGARNASSNHGEFQFMHPGSDSSYSVGLQLWDESSSNYIKLGVPVGDFGSNIDVIFPQFTGLGGQFLTTDGLGNLNWGNPASVSASGGGQIQADGSYAPEGGAGLGVGQTWTGSNLIGVTRFSNTTYTNSNTCPIAIAITFATGDDTNSAILVNGVEVSKWDVEGLGSTYYRTLYAVVPAGQSYIGFVRDSSINYWTEMTTTGSCASPGGLGVNQAWGGQSRSLNTAYTNNSGFPIALSIKLGVANAATATLRVSNSGAPGAGDEVDQFNATTIGSAAGDNFITLFGVVPDGGQYDVVTSGLVTNFGWYELRGPTPVNGGGLGVGQTWGVNLNPATRVANTAYENTDSCPRHIQVRLSGITDTRVQTGATAGTLTDVSRQDPGGVTTTNHSVVLTVPAGRFYRINTSDTITSWKEMSGGTCSAAALTKIIDADLDTFIRVAETATGDQDRIDMRVGDNSGNFDVSNNIMQLSTAGVTIQVPDANGTSGTEDGGSVTIEAGDGDSGGTGGAIFLQPGYGGSGAPAIPTGSGIPEPTEIWFVDAQGTPGYVGFKAPNTVVTNTVWTLPDDDGTINQRLITDGSGVLSWDDPVAPGAPDTAIQYNNSGSFAGDADLTWNETTNVMTIGSIGTPGTITSPVTANLTIATADNTGTTDVGGTLTLQGADALASATTGSAGAINFLSGGGQNLVNAADINITAGNMASATKATGGNVNIQAGGGHGGGLGGPTGGRVIITGGAILNGSGSGGGSGDVVVTGGVGGSSYFGGDVRLTSGAGDQAGNIELIGGTGSNGGGGNVFVTATNHATGAGGNVLMDAGDSGGVAKGGDFFFTAGLGNGTGNGGDIVLVPGNAAAGGAVDGRVIINNLSGAAGTPSRLAFKAGGNEYVQIQAPTPALTSGTFTLTLPPDEGAAGQVLTTDGADPATLSWITLGSAALTWPLLANPNGIAGAPAYSFSGKATVGMYSDAANTIGFSTDGDPRVTITNTATTLKREGAVEHQLRFEDGTDGTYVGLQAPNNVTTQVVWALPVADGATDGEVMATNGSGELKFQKMEFIYSSAGASSVSHVISHNLNQQYVTYTIWDRSTNQRINNAATETATDANTLTLTFTVAQDIIVAIMGVPGLAVNT